MAEYRNILGQLWLLNIPDAPRARQADLEDARRLRDEQAKLCDELGPAFAAAVSRKHAGAWARAMGRCPWCGMAGMFHDPESGQEMALCYGPRKP
jgi:hypothetical protein